MYKINPEKEPEITITIGNGWLSVINNTGKRISMGFKKAHDKDYISHHLDCLTKQECERPMNPEGSCVSIGLDYEICFVRPMPMDKHQAKEDTKT